MQINGEKLTMNNYWQHYLDLLIPASAFSLKITEEDMEGGTQEKDISSEAMYCNTVLWYIRPLNPALIRNYSMYSKNSKARISLT